MKDALRTTLVDIIGELESQGLLYALVGGLAASVRGRIRVTDDIDLVLKCNVNQAMELIRCCDREKFSPLLPDVESVARAAFLIPLVHQRTGIQLDLAIGVSGFEQQIVSRATRIQIAQQEVSVATAEDLLLMKVLAGRPQDDQDVRGIVDVQGATLDWEYCLSVAGQLEQAVGVDMVARVRLLRKQQR